MRIGLKKSLALVVLAALPCSVLAAPTVTFEGEVTSQTCQVSVNGETNSIVLLKTASMAEFGTTLAAGQTAQPTSFTISVSGCTAPTANQNITTRFLGYDVDSATGVLGNIASTDAATGFGIQLYSDGSGASPVFLSGLTDVDGLVLAAGDDTASHDFSAAYYVLDASSATAGKITSVAEYVVSYL